MMQTTLASSDRRKRLRVASQDAQASLERHDELIPALRCRDADQAPTIAYDTFHYSGLRSRMASGLERFLDPPRRQTEPRPRRVELG